MLIAFVCLVFVGPVFSDLLSDNSEKNLTDVNFEGLFIKEVDKIISEGPSNRFWNLFTDPEQKSLKNLKLGRGSSRNLASTQFVQRSPLATNAIVQKSLQSSLNARAIDASSTIGLRVARQFGDATNFQVPNKFCPFEKEIACDRFTKFRSIDGTCNNLERPWLGKAEMPYKRYLPPAYQDGLGAPRSLGKSGRALPNPRLISRMLFNENNAFDLTFTHLSALFGQFIAHDVTSASVSTGKNLRHSPLYMNIKSL